MAGNEKTPKRSRGEHLKKNEVKTEIISYVLSKNDVVPSPNIIKHLLHKLNILDEKNIRNHLIDLQEQHCIEKIQGKPGFENKWEIKKIESLQNIQEHYSKIELNKYEKSLMIVLQKNGYDISTFIGIEFYVKLLLSSSFFEECLGTDIKTLWEKARKIYARKHPLTAQSIKDDLILYYDVYKKRYPILNISYEFFESTMTQISQREISPAEFLVLNRGFRTTDKHFAEKFLNIWEVELLKLPKEKLDKMHREITDADLDIYWGMNITAFEINRFNNSFENQRFDLLFDHYVDQDIFKGVASEEEIDFTIKIKANEEELRNDFSEYLSEDESGATTDYMIIYGSECRILSDFEQASKILAKYKHPSVFGNIYDSPTTTSFGILEIFSQNGELSKVMPYHAEERMEFLSEYES